MAIAPEAVVSYSTAAMLFATPIAVIINTVLQQKIANRQQETAAKVATEVEAVRLTHAATENKVDQILPILLPKVQEVHTLVNNNLTQALARADAAALLAAQAVSRADDMEKRLTVVTDQLNAMIKKRKQ